MPTGSSASYSYEKVLLAVAVALTSAALALALTWPAAWDRLSKEDTGAEAATVAALGLLAWVAAARAWRDPGGSRWPLGLLAALALFAAGEEVSWGQRAFAFEAPSFFATHNVQAETNLHNLIPPPFDGLLGLVLLVLFALAPTQRLRRVARWWEQRGVPWPSRRHVATLFGCALPAGLLAAAGVDGLEELVELVAVLVLTAVVVARPSPTKQLRPGRL